MHHLRAHEIVLVFIFRLCGGVRKDYYFAKRLDVTQHHRKIVGINSNIFHIHKFEPCGHQFRRDWIGTLESQNRRVVTTNGA